MCFLHHIHNLWELLALGQEKISNMASMRLPVERHFCGNQGKVSLDKTTKQSVSETYIRNADVARGRSGYFMNLSTQLTFHVVHDLQGRYWRRPEPQSVYYWLWPQPQSGSIGYNRNLSSGSIGCLPRMPYTVFSHRPVGVGGNLEGCEVHSLGRDVI